MRLWMTSLLAALAACSCAAASQSTVSLEEIRQRVVAGTAEFRDLTATITVGKADQKELAVIGPEYGEAYRLQKSTLKFKAPDNLKMTADAGLMKVTYIVAGNRKIVRAGPIRRNQDISNAPHKKQTTLDIGLMTGALWDHFRIMFEREDELDGIPVYVLSLTLANSPDKKQLVWLDRRDLRLYRRDKLEADGSLRVRQEFLRHTRAGGVIWLPLEVRVLNKDGKLAATSVLSDVVVNSGISDDEFK